jgi:hypothetical protein
VRPDTSAKGGARYHAGSGDRERLGQQTTLPSLELASETTVQIAGNGGFMQ